MALGIVAGLCYMHANNLVHLGEPLVQKGLPGAEALPSIRAWWGVGVTRRARLARRTRLSARQTLAPQFCA